LRKFSRKEILSFEKSLQNTCSQVSAGVGVVRIRVSYKPSLNFSKESQKLVRMDSDKPLFTTLPVLADDHMAESSSSFSQIDKTAEI
jgi:hypothetical protein